MDSANAIYLNEPYKINAVENISFTSHANRLEFLKQAHFNPFCINHQNVIIDLLTDSGTNSMSVQQMANSILGDESYAGSHSFTTLKKNVKFLTGFEHILPVHQKRLGEEILCEVLAQKDGLVVANTFTHTMKANLREVGSVPVSLVTTDHSGHFGGNLDMGKFRSLVSEKGAGSIDFVILNVPSKILGGLPVNLSNMKELTVFCRQHSILVFLESSMYVENSWFIKSFEIGQSERELVSIAQEMFSYFDGCILSFARDGKSLTGSVLTCNDEELKIKFQSSVILKAGFISYGGMSGRLMERSHVGLLEDFNDIYSDFRFRQMHTIGELFKKNGVPIIEPIGTNTIFIDIDEISNKSSFSSTFSYPAWSLNCAAYVYGGIRGAEYGRLAGLGSSLPDNHPLANKELIKLEIPRRTYTICHYLYAARVFGRLIANERLISDMELLESPLGRLRHLKMKLEPVHPEKLSNKRLEKIEKTED